MMKVIRFLEPFLSSKTGLMIPELIISLKSISIAPINSSRDRGTVITVNVALFETLEGCQKMTTPCDRNTITDDLIKNKVCTQKKYIDKEKIDNTDFGTYFSDSAIIANGGDIAENALKYYREVILVDNGIELSDTELIEV